MTRYVAFATRKGIYYELASDKVLACPTEIYNFVLGEVLISYRNF